MISDLKNKNSRSWIKEILQLNTGIDFPDSRSLYKYQVSKQQFSELQSLVRSFRSEPDDLNRTNFSAACFVMYGAEWYKREYKSGKWQWKGLWQSLGYELEATLRGSVIRKGLKYWKLSLLKYESTSASYLGSVYSQGGLPFQLLKKENSTISQLLRRMIDSYQMNTSNSEMIEQLLSEESKAYQSQTKLFDSIINQLFSYVEKHRLRNEKAPHLILDEKEKNWRRNFPIPLDQENGQDLLNCFLSDVLDAHKNRKKVARTNDLRAIHYLSENIVINQNSKVIETKIEFPQKIDISGQKVEPQRVLLVIKEGDNLISEVETGYLRENGTVYQIKKDSILVSKKYASRALFLELINDGSCIYRKTIKQSVMPLNMPLSFAEKRGRWQFIGAGRIRTRADLLRVFIPEQLSYRCEEGVSRDLNRAKLFENSLEENKGILLETGFDLICSSDQDDQYTIKLNQEHENNPLYDLGSVRELPYKSKPFKVYLGKPKLWEDKTEINNYCERLNEQWTPTKTDENIYGVFDYRVRDASGETLFREKLGILPKDFKVVLIPDKKNILQARVLIKAVKGFRIVLDPIEKARMLIKIQADGDQQELQIKCFTQAPKELSLKLYAPHNLKNSISIKVPYPVSGCRIFDNSSKEIGNKSHIKYSDLIGTRIQLFAMPNRQEHFILSLQQKPLSISFKKVVTNEPRIFSLYDYKAEIRSLLILDRKAPKKSFIEVSQKNYIYRSKEEAHKRLGAEVHLSVLKDGKQLFQMTIADYNSELTINKHSSEFELKVSRFVFGENEDFKENRIHAILLSKPEQTPILLKENVSEGVGTGCFTINKTLLNDGPWLLSAEKNSFYQFRPIVYNNDENQEPVSNKTLYSAVKSFYIYGDEDKITEHFMQMQKDFSHSGWNYLQTLLNQYSHLFLMNFKVFELSSRSLGMMACLMFRLEMSSELLEKVVNDLSVLWERIPCSKWQVARDLFENWLIETGDSKAEAQAEVEEKIEGLFAVFPPIKAMLSHSQSEGKINHPIFVQLIKQYIEKMLHRQNLTKEWPGIFDNELKKWIGEQQDFPAFRNLKIKREMMTVFSLPLLLAAVTAQKVLLKDVLNFRPRELFYQIYRIKEFDMLWFEQVYSLAMAYLIEKAQSK